MERKPVIVSCELVTPLGGDAPMLDAIVLDRWVVLRHQWRRVTRSSPRPDILRHFAADRFPLGHSILGGYVVPHCSAPILSTVRSDRHDHYHRRFPVAEAVRYCAADQRAVIATTMGDTKAYRLPIRERLVEQISWIVEANVPELRKLLKDVHSLGKKDGHGRGALARAESGDHAAWTFRDAPGLAGAWYVCRGVLMRPLPIGPWLPEGLLGARRDYSTCSPPYWHPDNYTEIMRPC